MDARTGKFSLIDMLKVRFIETLQNLKTEISNEIFIDYDDNPFLNIQ